MPAPRHPLPPGIFRSAGNPRGLLGFLLLTCLTPLLPAQDPFIVETCDSIASPLPGPERAKAAARRVTPLLEPDLKRLQLQLGDPVYLRAFKEEATLELWMRSRLTRRWILFRQWKIAALSGKLGPKLAEGDRQVPEGFYFVPPAGMKPDSVFHLAFNIGYPNLFDRTHGRTGSFIMIHGNRISIGCLAMTDPVIEEIYTLCDASLHRGQPFFRVHIFPFRFTETRLLQASKSPWFEFWKNLEEGDRFFQTHRVPPEVEVRDGRYTFHLPPGEKSDPPAASGESPSASPGESR